jgi:hypothetical protein
LEETDFVKEPELVTIKGLQFKKYQMSCIRDMAIKYNHGSVNEFITETVLTSLLMKLDSVYGSSAGRYSNSIREKLREDCYGNSIEKFFTPTGAPDEIMLDNIEEIIEEQPKSG